MLEMCTNSTIINTLQVRLQVGDTGIGNVEYSS